MLDSDGQAVAASTTAISADRGLFCLVEQLRRSVCKPCICKRFPIPIYLAKLFPGAAMTSTPDINGKSEGLPPRRSSEWYTAIGFEKPWGLKFASFYEKLSFGWGAPLLEKGSYGQITEEMADALPPPEDEAPLRAQQFADCYDRGQVRARVSSLSRRYVLCASRTPTWFCLDWPTLSWHHQRAAGRLGFRQDLVLEEQPGCQDSTASALEKDGSAWLLDIA